ncbi:unnamed protein product [Cladocopium goreaui]|uniref:Sodium channel protein 60E n=1 Tax=Cladocopium goreaui TaxID=2562237 RepID=A0A9P1D543_9DINO|nr:unnamed protein product [Cladocopium goreaui]
MARVGPQAVNAKKLTEDLVSHFKRYQDVARFWGGRPVGERWNFSWFKFKPQRVGITMDSSGGFLESSRLLEQQIQQLLQLLQHSSDGIRSTLAKQKELWPETSCVDGEQYTACSQDAQGGDFLQLPGELAPGTSGFTPVLPVCGPTSPARATGATGRATASAASAASAASCAMHRRTVQLAVSQVESEVKEVDPSQMVFIDAKALKKKLKEDLCKESYDVSRLYHTEGFCQRIARSRIFEAIVFVVLSSNAIWTGIEMELDGATMIHEAHPAIIVVENLFVLFFSMELGIRFGAFRRKREAFKDGWFVFDAVLVFLMWSETWFLSICLAIFAPEATSPGFRLMRLMRFTRLARMARLLRSIPELLIIVRAIAIALRSVFFLMVLLLGLVYLFGLLFTQLLDGKNQPPGSLAYDSFRSLPQSMNTLLLAGALPDQSSLVEDAGKTHPLLYPLMLLYMLLASLTVMNMLVGILCEVVTVVSAVEKEEILLKSVKSLLKQLLLDAQADEDGDGSISRKEFDQMFLGADENW